MASVCGSTLSLMDAGVPIKAPVAGIAMGLVYADGKYTYQVQGSVVVPGSDYNTIVAWTPQPTVTLYACHPPGSATHRIVIRADYVGKS